MGKNMKTIHIVEIEWVDSCSKDIIWECKDGLESIVPLPCVSIGYLLEKTKTHITIAQTLSRQAVARRFTIPIGCVKKIRRV